MSKLNSEDEALTILDRYFPNQGGEVLLGRGDDCAVLTPQGRQAVSCDIFAEDSHFRRRYFTPGQIGHKSLAVNLSDLAACGAKPRAFTLCLTLTGQEDTRWLEEFAKSMAALAAKYELFLAGGDLTRAGYMNISINAWGDTPEELPLGLLRGQAVSGDVIFVIGTLGLGRLGLEVLEYSRNRMEMEHALGDWPQACNHHLQPDPLVEDGAALAALAIRLQNQGLEHRLALMDVSDGLARDLPRLLATPSTGLGAEIYLNPETLHEEIIRYAQVNRLDGAWFACQGGEDYALLASCSPAAWEIVAEALPQALRIGSVTEHSFMLNGRPFPQRGYDHFGV